MAATMTKTAAGAVALDPATREAVVEALAVQWAIYTACAEMRRAGGPVPVGGSSMSDAALATLHEGGAMAVLQVAVGVFGIHGSEVAERGRVHLAALQRAGVR